MQDKEEIELDRQGRQLADFLNSDGWAIVKAKFEHTLLDLQSILNITAGKPEELMTELYARKLAVTYLMDLLKDIEGTAQQYKGNKEEPTIVQY